MMSWLDDALIHAHTVNGLIESIMSFLVIWAHHNIKLHPAKCSVFAIEARWYIRLVPGNGLHYDPRRLDRLLSMEPLTTSSNR